MLIFSNSRKRVLGFVCFMLAAAPLFAAMASLSGAGGAGSVVYQAGTFTLAQGDSVQVSNLTLTLQSDGNLVLNQGSTTLWSSGSGNQNCGKNNCSAQFLQGGALVIYNGSAPIWDSQTGGNPGAVFIISPSAPYLSVVRSDYQTILWSSYTGADTSFLLPPNSFRGALTRYEDGHNEQVGGLGVHAPRYSISPDMSGMGLAAYYNNLINLGVNVASVDLFPSDHLSTEPISATDWTSYLNLYWLPQDQIVTLGQPTILFFNGVATSTPAYSSGIRSQISYHDYTVAQRDQSLLTFFRNLENLRIKGLIPDGIKFFIDYRIWFMESTKDGLEQMTWDVRQATEAVAENDISDFINKARDQNVDHWIAGFKIYEHANPDMGHMLPIYIDLATVIDAKTNGWMRSHAMIGAGGSFGANFLGVDNVQCPQDAGPLVSSYTFTCAPGTPLDFFGLMSQHTASFAFAYKFMEFSTACYYGGTEAYINGVLSAYLYANSHSCNNGMCETSTCTKSTLPAPVSTDTFKAAQWYDFLTISVATPTVPGLGFNDLVTFINSNAAQYPMYANVVFVGDDSDSLHVALDQKKSGQSGHCDSTDPRCAVEALNEMFTNANQGAGGWTGRLFMDATDNLMTIAPTVSTADTGAKLLTKTDTGATLFYENYDPLTFEFVGSTIPVVQPMTQSLWGCWPYGQGCRPYFTYQSGNTTVNAGSSATLSVQASGVPPLRYQWYANRALIAGATSMDYTVVNVDASLSGTSYTVKVTDGAKNTATSGPMVLTVAQ